MEHAPWEVMSLVLLINQELKAQTKTSPIKNYAGLGFQLVAFVIVLVYGGDWADNYFKTDPILLLTGVFLAVFGVIYLLISKFK